MCVSGHMEFQNMDSKGGFFFILLKIFVWG